MYYARSENKFGEKESVAHHLQLSAKLAEDFGKVFDEGQNAKCVALLHDIGKYSELFQNVLEKKAFGVNHAAVGATVLKDNLILASVVYAHHSSLDMNIQGVLKRIDKGADKPLDADGRTFSAFGRTAVTKCMIEFNKENELVLPHKPEWINTDNDFRLNIEKMLYTRMIYSCLVDADYTSSAAHFDKAYLDACIDRCVDATKDFQSLEKYKHSLSISSDSAEAINNIRNKVYDDCVKSAEHKPGMFTLTAPTGTGKTLALLAFSLKHAAIYKKRRIIIVLPFLSIIEQNAAIYKNICESVFEQHSATDYKKSENDEMLRIYSDRWSAEIIVTTSVNFFEGLFKSGASDCRRLHSIADSIIIFDEAQSIPVGLIDASIGALNCLCDKYKCSVVLSTATQPAFQYRKNVKWNPHEIIQNQEALFAKMNRVDVEWKTDLPVSLRDIAEKMCASKSCCAIVNLKAHCEKLYNYMISLCSDETVFMISTNMCTQHRRDVLKEIEGRLKEGKPCRIISTQCIEAGVDLDVDEIYRALAPLEAIIQSAGRCNRNGRIKAGKILVFVPDEEKLYPDDNYMLAAMKVKTLLARHDGNLDINNTDLIKEYYQMLFENESCDNEKLISAINNWQFDETEKNYRFINNSGVNIIVPYEKEMKLYERITEEIRSNGLTPSLMMEARRITVTSYDFEKAKNLCERTMQNIYFDGKKSKIETNWYRLCDENMYNKSGIHLDQELMKFYV